MTYESYFLIQLLIHFLPTIRYTNIIHFSELEKLKLLNLAIDQQYEKIYRYQNYLMQTGFVIEYY